MCGEGSTPTGAITAASSPQSETATGVPLNASLYRLVGLRHSLAGSFRNHSPLEGESQKSSRQAMADAVGGGKPSRRTAGARQRLAHRLQHPHTVLQLYRHSRRAVSSVLLLPQHIIALLVVGVPLPVTGVIHSGAGCLPPTGSTAGFALSPTPPQGGSDTGAPYASRLSLKGGVMLKRGRGEPS